MPGGHGGPPGLRCLMNKSFVAQWVEFLLFSLAAAVLSYVAFTAADTEAFHLWRSWRVNQAAHRTTSPAVPSRPAAEMRYR